MGWSNKSKRFLGWSLTSSLLLLSGLAFFVAGCGDSGPIKIGFLASTSGKISQLGQSARDGALLAARINKESGPVLSRSWKLPIGLSKIVS